MKTLCKVTEECEGHDSNNRVFEILAGEMDWLSKLVDTRIRLYFKQEVEYASLDEIEAPDLSGKASAYSDFLVEHALSREERILLLMALAPYLRPYVFDVFFTKNPKTERQFTEFGGVLGKSHGGFLPTGETVLFLLSGEDLQKRLEVIQLFEDGCALIKNRFIELNSDVKEEPAWCGALALSKECFDSVTQGISKKPDFRSNFPARLISTDLEWSDLVLEPSVMASVEEIRIWCRHGQTLINEWGMAGKVKRGYRTLFYGPSGTGKTMTVSLLGKVERRDVYRVDLSMISSKYIGETEKNLAYLFDEAETKNWILFFDEADAIFGKRTATTNSHDRYANQEVSYLLQRIEDFPGVVVLATNLKANIDPAFSRRFQSIIHFPAPNAEERLKLWTRAFSEKSILDDELDLNAIAQSYEVTGGQIVNVVSYSSLMALNRGNHLIAKHDVISGIKRELRKEGRTS